MTKKNQPEEEIMYDETDDSLSEKVTKLKGELKQCREERQEYLDGWQRAKADFINLKKRSADERIDVGARASESFIRELLPTLDSFEMAFKDKEAWEKAPEQWRKGIEYIYTQLQTVLENYGVQTIEPLQKPFNHDEHHSVATVQTDVPEEDGLVLEVILKGYKIKDSVIRPAQVKVGEVA